MSDTLVIDDLRFKLVRSARRRTVGVTVQRDGSLMLSVPDDCPTERVAEIAREKQFWVYTKLAEKSLLFRPTPEKEYISGETFHYLGRSYRLKLVSAGDQQVPLSLKRGQFMLRRDAVQQAHHHFVRWYVEHGQPWVARRVQLSAARIGVAPTFVEVRSLGYRWGSCSASGGVNFHWRSTLLPPRIIEYVVAHELVHLLVPTHGVEFWARLERAMPDYAARKQWLAEQGSGYF